MRTQITRGEMKLYYYAISCALSALVDHTARHGRGWYHFADGAVLIASEVKL